MALLIPEYLQTQRYNSQRLRMVTQNAAASQPGVVGATHYDVIQRALGANMSVDVGVGSALVPATNSGNKGYYHLENTSSVNVSISAANATNPRVDQIVLTVKDSTHGGDATDVPLLQVITGTPSAGAQISSVTGANYRLGAGALPNNSIRLADVIVPAAATSILTANINDRRPWAYGAFLGKTTVAAASTVATHTTLQAIPGLSFTLELSGAPIIATLTTTDPSTTTAWRAQMFLDATAFGPVVSAPTDVFAPDVFGLQFSAINAAPAAGRHVVAPFFATSGSSVVTTLPAGVQFLVQEIPQAFAENT